MDNEIEPIPGNWYENLTDGELFQVVAYDDSDKLVELQHFDGDLEEVSLKVWRGMDVQAAEAPEDWTGPIDKVERDDVEFNEPATTDTVRQKMDPEGPGSRQPTGTTAERLFNGESGEEWEPDRE